MPRLIHAQASDAGPIAMLFIAIALIFGPIAMLFIAIALIFGPSVFHSIGGDLYGWLTEITGVDGIEAFR